MNTRTTQERSRPRYRAWRNVMVASVNAGIERGVLSLLPGAQIAETVIQFRLDQNIVQAAFSSDHWDEIHVQAFVNPRPGVYAHSCNGLDGPLALYADCQVRGWVERRHGPYVQDGALLRCRRAMVHGLSGLAIEPNGYADHGRLRL